MVGYYLSIVGAVWFLVFFAVFSLMYINKKVAPVIPGIITSISKFTAVICFMVAITLFLDLIIPAKTIETRVLKKNDSTSLSGGDYREAMNQKVYDSLTNGERVRVEVSPIYDDVKKTTLLERNDKVIPYPTAADYACFMLIILFTLPLLLFLKYSYQTMLGKYVYFALHIIALVGGIGSILLISKLIVIHVF